MPEIIGDIVMPNEFILPDLTYNHVVPRMSGALYFSGGGFKWTSDDVGTEESW